MRATWMALAIVVFDILLQAGGWVEFSGTVWVVLAATMAACVAFDVMRHSQRQAG